MISNMFNKNLVKILVFFLISPGSKYTRKEIKEKTEMNNVPFDNALNQLSMLGIVNQEKNLFRLNFDCEFREELEKIRKEFLEFNVPLKVFYILFEVSDVLLKFKQIKKAYLFGSYAKLIHHEKSDIDIAVVFRNKVKDKSLMERKISGGIKKVEKRFRKDIQMHFFLEKDMKGKDPVIKDILRNGKRLV